MKKIALIMVMMLSANAFAEEEQSKELTAYPSKEELTRISESWIYPILLDEAERILEEHYVRQEVQQGENK